MVGTLEKFCLQWNEFQGNVKTSYSSIRKTEDFSDVTLACEDGQEIKAHRVILSSSSIFFRDLLKKTSHIHPFVFMRGIKYGTLSSIVDFIYHGEVEVTKEDLDPFLATAGELTVKGMVKKPSQNIEGAYCQKELENKVKAGDEDRFNVNGLMQKNGNLWSCKVCGKTSELRLSLRNHVETDHMENGREGQFPVSLSDTTSDSNLTSHAQNKEGGSRPECVQCKKTYASEASLRTHMYNHIKKAKQQDAVKIQNKQCKSEIKTELTESDECMDEADMKDYPNDMDIGMGVEKVDDNVINGTDSVIEGFQDKFNSENSSIVPDAVDITDVGDISEMNESMSSVTKNDMEITSEYSYSPVITGSDDIRDSHDICDTPSVEGLEKIWDTFPSETEVDTDGDETIDDPAANGDENLDLEAKIDALTTKEDGVWVCIQCGKHDRSRFHLRRHAEIHVGGFTHPCPNCSKAFTTRANLKGHILNKHPERKVAKAFECDECDKSSVTSAALNIHKIRKHRTSEPSAEPASNKE